MAETTPPPAAQRIAELEAVVANLAARQAAIEADFEKLCSLLGTAPSRPAASHLRVVE